MDKRYTRSWWAVVLFLVVFLSTSAIRRCGKNTYRYDEGLIFGTFYHITYKYPESLSGEIKNRLLQFDASLSPFNDTSIISQVNRNEPVETDRWFEHVFNASRRIYTRTGGTFDPTVSPLVNAWGFGFKKGVIPDSVQVDSLLRQVGMNKLAIENHRVLKSDTCITLNFSAIAKGYACDVIGNYLTEKGVSDYLVEIGGEIVAKGRNPQGDLWSVGINRPDTAARYNRGEISRVLHFSDAGLATSGNYRNYRYIDGKRVAHTIDPVGGYPVQHALLSSTVMADDCMTADAYATAFMVMGLDRSRALLEQHPEIKALFIYALDNDSTAMAVYSTLP